MGRYLEQTEGRSELQQRIAADLRAKASAKAKQEGEHSSSYYNAPDGVEDAAYMKGTKTTTTLAPAWAAIVIIVFVIFGVFIYQATR
ncbi:MAG: hypothetical protein ABIP74_04880 [Candidatus Saccharimonas sp.]